MGRDPCIFNVAHLVSMKDHCTDYELTRQTHCHCQISHTERVYFEKRRGLGDARDEEAGSPRRARL